MNLNRNLCNTIDQSKYFKLPKIFIDIHFFILFLDPIRIVLHEVLYLKRSTRTITRGASFLLKSAA